MGDLDVDGRVILKWLLKETGYEGMNWIQVIHNRVQWWGLVNLRFPEKAENSWPAEQLLTSQEGLCSV
jgi:hypothetical protein